MHCHSSIGALSPPPDEIEMGTASRHDVPHAALCPRRRQGAHAPASSPSGDMGLYSKGTGQRAAWAIDGRDGEPWGKRRGRRVSPRLSVRSRRHQTRLSVRSRRHQTKEEVAGPRGADHDRANASSQITRPRRHAHGLDSTRDTPHATYIRSVRLLSLVNA